MTAKLRRSYPRVLFVQPAIIALNGWHWDQLYTADVTIYQLGPTGCGITSDDKGFQMGQHLSLDIPNSRATNSLRLCARVVWKQMQPDFIHCRYGLKFLWIENDKKRGDVETFDPVLTKLNRALRPTGFRLLPGSSI
jgi:hypothetical protein